MSTILHDGKTFDDAPLKPYGFTKRLIRNHFADELETVVVYGSPEGVGKSAYISHVLADAYGYITCKDKDLVKAMWAKGEKVASMPKWKSDWERVKDYTWYLPSQVVTECIRMLDDEKVDISFHWDDAGTWLYVMEYHDPFVIAFMEYLALARSNWKGGIILSTPYKEWVLTRLRTSSGILHVMILKPEGHNYEYIWKPRIAKCYRKTIPYPGAKRPYWPVQWLDRFSAIMPDPFYEWYKPRRDAYATLAAQKMKEAIAKRKKRGWNTRPAEEKLEEIEKHIWEANDKAPELHEAIAQNK